MFQKGQQVEEYGKRPQTNGGEKNGNLNNPAFYKDHIVLITKLQALYRGHVVRMKIQRLKEFIIVFQILNVIERTPRSCRWEQPERGQ